MQQYTYIYIFFSMNRCELISSRIPLFCIAERIRKTNLANLVDSISKKKKKNYMRSFFPFYRQYYIIQDFYSLECMISRPYITELQTISPKEQVFKLEARNLILIRINIENRPLLADSLKRARQGLFLSHGVISLY